MPAALTSAAMANDGGPSTDELRREFGPNLPDDVLHECAHLCEDMNITAASLFCEWESHAMRRRLPPGPPTLPALASMVTGLRSKRDRAAAAAAAAGTTGIGSGGGDASAAAAAGRLRTASASAAAAAAAASAAVPLSSLVRAAPPAIGLTSVDDWFGGGADYLGGLLRPPPPLPPPAGVPGAGDGDGGVGGGATPSPPASQAAAGGGGYGTSAAASPAAVVSAAPGGRRLPAAAGEEGGVSAPTAGGVPHPTPGGDPWGDPLPGDTSDDDAPFLSRAARGAVVGPPASAGLAAAIDAAISPPAVEVEVTPGGGADAPRLGGRYMNDDPAEMPRTLRSRLRRHAVRVATEAIRVMAAEAAAEAAAAAAAAAATAATNGAPSAQPPPGGGVGGGNVAAAAVDAAAAAAAAAADATAAAATADGDAHDADHVADDDDDADGADDDGTGAAAEARRLRAPATIGGGADDVAAADAYLADAFIHTSAAPVLAVGRVVVETDGGGGGGVVRLRRGAVALESVDGRRIKLDIESTPPGGVLFPGAVIAAWGVKVNWSTMVVSRLFDDPGLPAPLQVPSSSASLPSPSPQRLASANGHVPTATATATATTTAAIDGDGDVAMGDAPFNPSPPPPLPEEATVVIASGPFTTPGNVAYRPLDAVLDVAAGSRAALLVLTGPFIAADHPTVAACVPPPPPPPSPLPDDGAAAAATPASNGHTTATGAPPAGASSSPTPAVSAAHAPATPATAATADNPRPAIPLPIPVEALLVRRVLSRLGSFLDSADAPPGLTVVLVPSADDAAAEPLIPTPPFRRTGLSAELPRTHPRVILAPNPAVVTLRGASGSDGGGGDGAGVATLAVTATPILEHLAADAIVPRPAGSNGRSDRLGAIAAALLRSRSLYPLHPPPRGVAIDIGALPAAGLSDAVAAAVDVLVLPARLGPFVKVDVGGGVAVVNPGRAVKGAGAGTLAVVRLSLREGGTREGRNLVGEIRRV